MTSNVPGMQWRLSSIAMAIVWGCASGQVSATPVDSAKQGGQKAANAASATAVKVEGAVKRGASAATTGIRRGVKAANDGADTAARKIGVPGVGTKPTTPDASRQTQ